MNNRYQLKAQRHSSHSQIYELLKHAPVGSRILDLGVAAGYIGNLLSEFNFELIGIERDKSQAEQAKPYYRKIHVLDLEKEDLSTFAPFNFIIACDILEHLKNPEGILLKLVDLLKGDGKIIISIPNIANCSVRFNLLFGNFDYANRGILDRGHLRFFTYKSAKRLITEAGFKIINFYPTSIPFEFIFRPLGLSNYIYEFYYFFAGILPRLFAYQFVFIAQKQERK